MGIGANHTSPSGGSGAAHTRGLTAYAVVLCLTGSPHASARPLVAAVQVERSPEASDCPDRRQLSDAVEVILERPLEEIAPADAEVRVHVSFDKEGQEYRARLSLRGSKSGERTLSDSSSDCAPLAEAVSVAMALFLDQELPEEQGESAPQEPAPQEPAPLDNKARTGTPLSFSVLASGGVAFGLAPETAPYFQGGLRLARGLFRLDSSFGATLPTTAELPPGQVRVSGMFGSVRACAVWGTRWAVGPCAALGLGRLRGVGEGYEDVSRTSLWWTAVGPGLLLQGPLGAGEGRSFWGVDGVLWLPTLSQTFQVENVGFAWESPPVQGTICFTLGVRL